MTLGSLSTLSSGAGVSQLRPDTPRVVWDGTSHPIYIHAGGKEGVVGGGGGNRTPKKKDKFLKFFKFKAI